MTISDIAATGSPHEERLSVRATVHCPDAKRLPLPPPAALQMSTSFNICARA